MQVLLDDDVAAGGELGILVADEDRGRRCRPGRVLGAVDEPQQVALVEVLEPVHLVDHGRVFPEPTRELAGELEAQVHPPRPDVEEQIAGRRDGLVALTGELRQRAQRGRPRAAEEPIPERRADADHACQLAVGDAEPD